MILSRAPLRITLGGGGTDLPSFYARHGGFILSAAIDKYIYICINRPAADALIRLKYSVYEETADIADIKHDLVRPALDLLELRSNLEIVSMADVPAGTGLGSSSTYLVALLVALHDLKRDRMPQQALAEQAFRIERELAGHSVGKQDHYLAAFGGLTCLDIEPDGRVQVSPLDMPLSALEELHSRMLLFFTAQSRGAETILRDQHQATERCDADVVESLRRTKEIGLSVKDALERADLDAFGHLLHEHWMNKKRRSSKISSGMIDRWYETARGAGAVGGKIIGAGGGGFLMFYCPPAAKTQVREALRVEGLREMPYAFDFEGAKVLVNF
jgi:D-glycero-alpha-D-manno-heptose-7-phosphate kinase